MSLSDHGVVYTNQQGLPAEIQFLAHLAKDLQQVEAAIRHLLAYYPPFHQAEIIIQPPYHEGKFVYYPIKVLP
jgi:hypothetical protein